MKTMDEKQQAEIERQVDLARRVWCRPDWERVITIGSRGDGVGSATGFRFAHAGEYKVGDKIDDGYGWISTVVCII